MTKTKRYEPNSGWINVQLSDSANGKLRQMAAESRPKVTMTAVLESALEREWEVWEKRRAAEMEAAS